MAFSMPSLLIAFVLSGVTSEAFPVFDEAGRFLATVPIESTNLDRVSVAAHRGIAAAVVAHGRAGGASLYLVDGSGARELLRTSKVQSLSQPAFSADGVRFALALLEPPSWLAATSPMLQSHGRVLVGGMDGSLIAVPVLDDVGAVLGWQDAKTLVVTRMRPGDLPEERPWLLDLGTGVARPLCDEGGHLYGLKLFGDRLYFARSERTVVTLPAPADRVELVERNLATGVERAVAVEYGALPVATRLGGHHLVYELDGTLTSRSVDLETGEVQTDERPRPTGTSWPSPHPGGDMAMPYIHQVYDTPDEFNGNWACGPTSTLMCVQHHNRLAAWPVTVSVPSPHNSDFGAYVSKLYSAFGSTFDRAQGDASGRTAYGAYGWCTDQGAAWAWRMQDYAERHDLSSDFYSPSNFGDVSAAIDAGKTVALSTRLTSAGHIVAVKGYTGAGEVVTNDPYGNKNSGYMNYAGETAIYTWAQVNSSWFITVYGTVTPTNKPPTGYLDSVDCTQASGWSQDPDEPGKAIDVHVYWGGSSGSGAKGIPVNAGDHRDDLCGAIGSCSHGFHLRSPFSLFDGAAHEVHAYGIDTQGGDNPELGSSPKTLQCTAQLAGVKRHVTDPAVFAAWKFDAFMDQVTVPDSALDELPTEVDVAPEPVMIRADGQPEVYLIDRGFRRHVPSEEVASFWRLDLGTVQLKTVAEVEAHPLAPPIRARPLLAIGSGPAVWLVDDALPGPDAGAPPGLDATTTPPRADASTTPPTPTDGGSVPRDGGIPKPGDGGSSGGEATGGCGCAAGGDGAAPGFWALLAVALAGRRRRSPA